MNRDYSARFLLSFLAPGYDGIGSKAREMPASPMHQPTIGLFPG